MNPALILALAGGLSGALMATLAFAISRAPGWRELRSFALIAATAGVYCFLALVHVLPLSTEARLLGERLLLAASFTYALSWIRHLAVADRRQVRGLERGAMVVCTVLVFLALVPGVMIVPPIREVQVRWFRVTYTMASGTTLGFLAVLFVVTAVVGAAFGFGRRWRDGWSARLPMIGGTTLALSGISDTLASVGLIAMPQLMEAMTVVVVGTMGVSYARRFVADALRLEALSTMLENEVANRTGELLKAQAEVAHHERLAGLGRVAAGVAHEINNPTSVVQHNLDLLEYTLGEAGALTSDVAVRLDQSRSATRRIAEIVRQLLDTGRDPRATAVRVTSFRLAPAVARAVEAASLSAPELRISSSIPESLCARGDPALVEQVLINLIVNAAHASREAAGGGRAEIRGTRVGDRVRVAVRDNGSGIAPSIRERLFEPFATTKAVGHGTGLGLAVSRGLMTSQGGSLFVADSTADGTEMVLELPAAEQGDVAEPPAPDTRSDQPTNAGRRDLRVLVIDDNDDLRDVLVMQLRHDFHAEQAATVEQALSMIASGERYDVVLCDLMMPGVGGEGWLSSCAAIDPSLPARTILLTGGPTTREARALIEARRDKVLLKPFEYDDLRAMIARAAGRPD